MHAGRDDAEKANAEQAALRPRYPIRVTIALALILAAILLSQLSTVVPLVQTLRAEMASDDMAAYDQRLAEARKLLPRSGVIGYLSDPPEREGTPQGSYERHLYLAQYSLAPLILTDSTEPDLILGNFFNRDGMQKAMAGRKYLVLHDFRNGVFILRKEGP